MNTYTGGCHCGSVRYEVTMEMAKVISCNCSICTKHGLILAFAPADQFRLISGADDLKEYQFNKKKIRHMFCTTCGVESFGRGTNSTGVETVAINVRCLDDIDLAALTITPINGKDF